MTKETLHLAVDLNRRIERAKVQLHQVERIAGTPGGNLVMPKLGGISIDLPENAIRNQIR